MNCTGTVKGGILLSVHVDSHTLAEPFFPLNNGPGVLDYLCLSSSSKP